MPSPKLDMSTTLKLLDEVHELATELDGQALNVEGSNNKELMNKKSRISKQLLYAAHLADTTRLECLNQYHRFKGEEPPTINT